MINFVIRQQKIKNARHQLGVFAIYLLFFLEKKYTFNPYIWGVFHFGPYISNVSIYFLVFWTCVIFDEKKKEKKKE